MNKDTPQPPSCPNTNNSAFAISQQPSQGEREKRLGNKAQMVVIIYPNKGESVSPSCVKLRGCYSQGSTIPLTPEGMANREYSSGEVNTMSDKNYGEITRKEP